MRAGASSQHDRFQFDLVHFVYAQAQLRRILNMSRLPDECIEVRIGLSAEPNARSGAVEDRRGTLLLPLVFDDLNQETVHRNRVSSEHDLLRVETKALVFRKRSCMPDPSQAIHNVQYRAASYRLDSGQCSDE